MAKQWLLEPELSWPLNGHVLKQFYINDHCDSLKNVVSPNSDTLKKLLQPPSPKRYAPSKKQVTYQCTLAFSGHKTEGSH